jgi:hypothetical protein
MPKKQKPGPTLPTKTLVTQPALTSFSFPDISDKTDIECTVLLEDQILLLDVRILHPFILGLLPHHKYNYK